jgi:hypothetical protein
VIETPEVILHKKEMKEKLIARMKLIDDPLLPGFHSIGKN